MPAHFPWPTRRGAGEDKREPSPAVPAGLFGTAAEVWNLSVKSLWTPGAVFSLPSSLGRQRAQRAEKPKPCPYAPKATQFSSRWAPPRAAASMESKHRPCSEGPNPDRFATVLGIGGLRTSHLDSLKLSSVFFLLSKEDRNTHNNGHNPISPSDQTVMSSLEKAHLSIPESSSPWETSRDQHLVTAHGMSIGCGVSRFGVDFFKNSIGIYCLGCLHTQSHIPRIFKLSVDNFNGKIKHTYDCDHKLAGLLSATLHIAVRVSDQQPNMNGSLSILRASESGDSPQPQLGFSVIHSTDN